GITRDCKRKGFAVLLVTVNVIPLWLSPGYITRVDCNLIPSGLLPVDPYDGELMINMEKSNIISRY
ncbi:hypothetical protein VXE43_21280, partial [Acinetobacter baumannii]